MVWIAVTSLVISVNVAEWVCAGFIVSGDYISPPVQVCVVIHQDLIKKADASVVLNWSQTLRLIDGWMDAVIVPNRKSPNLPALCSETQISLVLKCELWSTHKRKESELFVWVLVLIWFAVLNSVRYLLFFFQLCVFEGVCVWMQSSIMNVLCVCPPCPSTYIHITMDSLCVCMHACIHTDVDISLYHSLPLTPLHCWQLSLCMYVCAVPEPQGPICCHAGHRAPLGDWERNDELRYKFKGTEGKLHYADTRRNRIRIIVRII